MRFQDKVAIITGGASGIGKATGKQLASEGARVLLADISPGGEAVAAAMRAESLDVHFQQTDVSKEADVAALVAAAVARWGRLDVMVANAGIGGRGAADVIEYADWERVIAVNLSSVYLCTRHAVPAMRATGGGAIVNTASVMGLVGTTGAVAYASAKGGVVNLTRASALDYAQENIRVNAVCPGHLNDPIGLGGAAARQTESPDTLARYPMGRLGTAQDVAYAIAFLASDQATFITGAMLAVDGGYSAR